MTDIDLYPLTTNAPAYELLLNAYRHAQPVDPARRPDHTSLREWQVQARAAAVERDWLAMQKELYLKAHEFRMFKA